MSAQDEDVPPAAAQTLQVIACAMAGGLVMMAGLVVFAYVRAEPKAPTADAVRMINAMTTVIMAVALASIVASELLWRSLLRRPGGALAGRVQIAYIVRLALREGAGLLGMTTAYLAALNGTLRAYPAYWVNLAPFGLFLGFLAAHFPSAEKLAAEAREALGSGL